MKSFGKKTTARRGFTLIEILAATAIMIVLVLFVTNIAVNMLKIYDRTIATLSTNADAGMVLDTLQDDLLSASMPDDGNYWFEVRYESDVDNVARYSAPELMFFSRPADRIRRERNSKEILPGELCAVSYKIAHRSPFGSRASSSSAGNLVYGCYRAVLNAKDTFGVALPYIIGQRAIRTAPAFRQNFGKAATKSKIPPIRKNIRRPHGARKCRISSWTESSIFPCFSGSMIFPTANAKSPS